MYPLEALRKLIHNIMEQSALITATLSQLRKREGMTYSKVTVKPVELKSKLHYQFAYYSGTKVTHQNVPTEEAEAVLIDMFENVFRQAMIYTPEADYQVLISKNTRCRF